MTYNEQFDWVDFYKEFAQKLLEYKKNRSELISIIKSVYEDIEINMPKLDLDDIVENIDPFTVFGLFNKHIRNENKQKILSNFAKKLNIQAKVPISFDGIPEVNKMPLIIILEMLVMLTILIIFGICLKGH